jgi:hypothetical protein
VGGWREPLLDPVDLRAGGFVPERLGTSGAREALHYDLILSPEEAADGGVFDLTIPLRRRCPACRGETRSATVVVCATCGGEGELVDEQKMEIVVLPSVRDGQQAAASLDTLGLRSATVDVTVRIRY